MGYARRPLASTLPARTAFAYPRLTSHGAILPARPRSGSSSTSADGRSVSAPRGGVLGHDDLLSTPTDQAPGLRRRHSRVTRRSTSIDDNIPPSRWVPLTRTGLH